MSIALTIRELDKKRKPIELVIPGIIVTAKITKSRVISAEPKLELSELKLYGVHAIGFAVKESSVVCFDASVLLISST